MDQVNGARRDILGLSARDTSSFRNGLKGRNRAPVMTAEALQALELRQRRRDHPADLGVELLDRALDERRHLDAGRDDFREIQATLLARHREVIGRRRCLLRLACRVGARDRGALHHIEHGGREEIAPAFLRVAADDEVVEIADLRRHRVFRQHGDREQIVGNLPHRVAAHAVGHLIGLKRGGLRDFAFRDDRSCKVGRLFQDRGIRTCRGSRTDRRLEPGCDRSFALRCRSEFRDALREREQHLVGIGEIELRRQPAGNHIELEQPPEDLEGIHAVRKQHAHELRIERGDALAEKPALAVAERDVEFGAGRKIPGRIRELERPHVMCVERVDHRDLVGVRQLARTAVEPLFLLLLVFLLAEMGPEDPVADADADVVRGVRDAAAQKARGDADA